MKWTLVGLFGVMLLGSAILSLYGVPLAAVSPITWAGMTTQALGLGIQIAGTILIKKNPNVSKTLTIVGAVISTIGIGVTLLGSARPGLYRPRPSRFPRRVSYPTQANRNPISTNHASNMQSRLSAADNRSLATRLNAPPPSYDEVPPPTYAEAIELTPLSSGNTPALQTPPSSSPISASSLSTSNSGSQGDYRYVRPPVYVNKPTVRPWP